MALTRAELMPPPGSGLTPIGGVSAGIGIKITPTGVISVQGGFPTGTRMPFLATTAPVGWFVVNSIDDTALRLVNTVGGTTGGVNGFTTAFASYTPQGSAAPTFSGFSVSGSTTGSAVGESQFGSHSHEYAQPSANSPSITAIGPGPLGIPVASSTRTNTTGGNGQHSHPLSGSLSGNVDSFTPTPTSQFEVRYIDLLLCEKD